MKVALTDRKLRSLKPAAPGQRPCLMDAVEPQFGVRIGDAKGDLTFILYGRMPGSSVPVRRTLGKYPSMTLAEGRAAAKAAKEQIAKGIDPREAKRQRREAIARRKKDSLGAVLADFVRDRLSTQRKGVEVERILRRHLADWMDRPAASITTREARDLIKAKKATRYEAHNIYGSASQLFSYALDEDCYNVEANPFASIKPSKLIGEKIARDRILSEDEIFALWRAASRTPYPAGAAYKLLILTALRLNEVVQASWSEFEKNNIWVIPAARMKGKNGKARPHAVPITAEIAAVLAELPRFQGGDYLFTWTTGKTPTEIGSKVKGRIDARMLCTLRALARRRGENPAKVMLPRWTNHDIRRSVRSQLSRIKTITEETREAVLAHVRPGIVGVYDRYDRLDEKREALEAWAARLRSIIEPTAPSDNVVQLRPGA
jgi:integrase